MTWQAVRVCGVLLALALMGGEAWRSWGAERPVVFVVVGLTAALVPPPHPSQE